MLQVAEEVKKNSLGMGGVGMAALMLAKTLLLSTIICVDIDDKKLSLAKDQGAHHVVNSVTTPPGKMLPTTLYSVFS